ncbi:MAG: glutathione S-transferase family protein [Ectothiorhodospiraceae bacterium]|nr:glutathione S-transferase family protein [Ectothiorhodospiraceae bacterium]
MKTDITLYTNPMSRGRIARWMLEETGAPYQTRYLDFGAAMKAPDYLAINPMGKVPAIRHGQTVVTESAAICAYLADAFPEAGLAPPPEQRGPYYRWLFFAAGPLESAITAHTILGEEPSAEQQSQFGFGSLRRVLDALEQAVSATPYIAGERFTAADVYVGAHIGWGTQFGTIEKRSAFLDYWRRVSDRDAWHRADELDNAAMPSNAP